ncbi:MAG: ABC transporter permease [Porticoccaceae bacterium]
MNLSLIRHFVRQDLVDKHAGSALGALWTVLLPLANILIFTLVFSRLMGARLEALGMDYLGQYSYSVYLITGLLAWNAFAATLTRITHVFHEKAGLITKVNVSLFALPLYIVVSEAIVYVISMVFFALFLILIGFEWTLFWFWLPVIFAIQQLLAYSIGLLCAIFSVFLHDIKSLVGVGIQLWFWLTPIVYVIDILPPRWQTVFMFNPLVHSMDALRDALILGRTPDLMALGLLAGFSLALLGVALAFGRYLERDIRDFL